MRESGIVRSCSEAELQALLAGILNQLEALLDTLLRDGFQPLQAAYLRAWLHTGQQVLHNVHGCATITLGIKRVPVAERNSCDAWCGCRSHFRIACQLLSLP